jgi:hypothetical protein
MKALALRSAKAEGAINVWLKSENLLISSIMEETVTNRQACLIWHASLAFITLIGAAATNVYAALFCLAWFSYSLFLCTKGGLK